jgi:sulfide:quinone oxidoreductase
VTSVLVVLGCGLAGVAAAREARRLLPRDYRVVVVDREPEAAYSPAFLAVATGARKPESIRRPRARLARRGIEFVQAEVRQIDTAHRYVRADSREFHYDHLVIALGSEPVFDGRPGLAEAAHHLCSLDGAERLSASLRYFAGGPVLVVVSGQPVRGPHLAYEAAMVLEHHFHARRMRQKIDLRLYTPEVAPLPAAGLDASETLLGLLKHKGIDFRAQQTLLAVDTERREAVFADGNRDPFQLLLAIPEQRAPALIRDAGLTDEGGWIPVNPATLETRFDGVFVAGDLARVRLGETELPKSSAFAAQQGRLVARQIAYRSAGGHAPESFDGRGRWFIETGGGAAAVLEGNFLAGPRHLQFKQPSVVWHWLNRAIERRWLLATY